MCTLSDFIVENTISNKKCSNGLDSCNRINQTVDYDSAEDEQQLVVTTEFTRSNLSSELLTLPQYHIDTPQVPNSRRL